MITSSPVYYCQTVLNRKQLLVAGTTEALLVLSLGTNPAELEQSLHQKYPHASLNPQHSLLQEAIRQTAGFLEKPDQAFDLPLDPRGTAFQKTVWQAIAQVPVGQTITYTELATRIGRPTAMRAVANACGANPLALIIPCHRIVRSDGGLGGYRWGLEIKSTLLEKEKTRNEQVF